MATQIQIRRGTDSEWTSADPTLLQGEIGFVTDLNSIKVGDGTTAWSSLSYISGNATSASYASTAEVANAVNTYNGISFLAYGTDGAGPSQGYLKSYTFTGGGANNAYLAYRLDTSDAGNGYSDPFYSRINQNYYVQANNNSGGEVNSGIAVSGFSDNQFSVGNNLNDLRLRYKVTDPNNMSGSMFLGITAGQAGGGAATSIVRSGLVRLKTITDGGTFDSTNWTTGESLYVGPTGSLTNIRPTNGRVINVGTVAANMGGEDGSWLYVDIKEEPYKTTLPVDVVTQSINFASASMFDFSYTTDSDVYIETADALAGRNAMVRLYITGSATSSLTLPSDWIYIGDGKPTEVEANKYYVFKLSCFGSDNSNIVCDYTSTK